MKKLWKNRAVYSLVILILVNLFPVFGVIFFDWNVFIIVLLYCIETFIIGLFNILKMLVCRDAQSIFLRLFMVIFFSIHFNMFVIIQTVFVVVFSHIDFVEMTENPQQQSQNAQVDSLVTSFEDQLTDAYLLEAIIVIALSHGFSFVFNFLIEGEYKKTGVGELMLSPYKRVIIQQVTVIFGGFAIAALHSPTILLLLLIVLKTIFDVRAHIKVHNELKKSRTNKCRL